MKEPKFKVGDLVTCVDDRFNCGPIVHKKCKIEKLKKKCDEYWYHVSCMLDGYSHASYWLVEENQLEPFIDTSVTQDCLTDPNVDYEK